MYVAANNKMSPMAVILPPEYKKIYFTEHLRALQLWLLGIASEIWIAIFFCQQFILLIPFKYKKKYQLKRG